MNVNSCLAALATLVVALGTASPIAAQYGEVPRPLPIDGFDTSSGRYIRAATQIGRRLFVGGYPKFLSPPLGGAVVLGPSGAVVPGAFPTFTGAVHQIVPDGRGGWIAVGGFTSVEGRPIAKLARVGADRHVDPSFTVDVDGSIWFVAVAHGRVYFAGAFRVVNGQRREGLAAVSLDTGVLSSWASDFDAGGRLPLALAASSIAVYVAASPSYSPSLPGRIWGLDTARGRPLFARTAEVRSLVASSSRVYVGGYGYARPVWAIDPLTGADQDWALGFRFKPLSSTTGEYTEVRALLLDAGRLYIGGYLRTEDDRQGLVVADAATGARVRWSPQLPPLGLNGIYRIGPAIAVAHDQTLYAFDPATAATLPFTSAVGLVRAVAPVPEGVVAAGEGFFGPSVAFRALSSIDLDTWTLEPWTSLLTMPLNGSIEELATDGQVLIVRVGGGKIAKVDPLTGAVLGEHRFNDTFGLPMRVKGGAVYVAYPALFGGGTTIGVITIADWSLRTLNVDIPQGGPSSLDVDGDTLYLAGGIDVVNGGSRPGLAAVSISTGALLPFRPAPDDAYDLRVLADHGRVWAAGGFKRIGGAWRRGLAELDPMTGAALPWNPDVPSLQDALLEVGPDGDLYVGSGQYAQAFPQRAAGQLASSISAYSMTTGRRRPWRHGEFRVLAVLPDCVIVDNGCLPRTSPPPANLQASMSGAALSLQWTLPPSARRTALRLEFGSSEGRANLYSVDLQPGETSFAAAGVPPGGYVARLRSLDGAVAGPPSDDVSFAVGRPAAPLSATVGVEQSLLTFAWRPPSSGAPQSYRLDVGSAPGLSNLASVPISGQATSFQVNAPLSRYWTRLYAVNGSTASSPTPDLLVMASPADVYQCGVVPPSEPQAVTASVTGGIATVTWQPPTYGVSVSYRLLAGSAPGLRDLATLDLGTATSFAAPVPPGRYYLAVQSLDACGTAGGVSPPVTLVVP